MAALDKAGARKAIVLQYDGSEFGGWQKQRHDPNTIQQKVEGALSQIADSPVRVSAAGRTDAGVHAIRMMAHFDTSAKRENYAWKMGANGLLPSGIRVLDVFDAEEGFHARFSACARSYRYLLWVDSFLPVFLRGRAAWIFTPVELEPMRRALPHVLGRRDFSTFRSAECQAPSPVKRVLGAAARREGNLFVFDFTATGFLHHMVRNIMGALVYVGRGMMSPEEFGALVEARDRRAAPPTLSAAGLYFVGAHYPPRFAKAAFAEPPGWFWGNCEGAPMAKPVELALAEGLAREGESAEGEADAKGSEPAPRLANNAQEERRLKGECPWAHKPISP